MLSILGHSIETPVLNWLRESISWNTSYQKKKTTPKFPLIFDSPLFTFSQRCPLYQQRKQNTNACWGAVAGRNMGDSSYNCFCMFWLSVHVCMAYDLSKNTCTSPFPTLVQQQNTLSHEAAGGRMRAVLLLLGSLAPLPAT